MSASASEKWLTMTGAEYMAYLETLAADAPALKVQSAEELFTDEERAAHLEHCAPVKAMRDARERIKNLHGEKAARAFDALAVVEASEFASEEDSEPDWQVRGLIPTTGTGLHTGASGTLKSFAELELAACIHRGVPFHGLEVTQGRAVIVVAEGVRGYKRRQRAYAKRHGVSLMDLPAIVPCPANLFDSGQVIALIEQIKLAGGATYCCFDTKWRCSVGADENSANDQAVVFGAMDRIARELNCFVMAVAHTGRDTTKGARGSSSQYAAVDVELTQERMGDYCTVRVTKEKDGESNAEYTFKVATVDLGRNQHDEPESSLVLEPTEAPTPPGSTAPKGKHEIDLYQLLKTKAPIHREDLLDEFAEQMKRNGTKLRRDNLRRTLESLEKKRLAFVRDEEVTLTSSLVQGNAGWME
jgi:hypothetical protein